MSHKHIYELQKGLQSACIHLQKLFCLTDAVISGYVHYCSIKSYEILFFY